MKTYDPTKIDTTIPDLIDAAFEAGRADALEMCAKTDEQRLRYISDLQGLMSEAASWLRQMAELIDDQKTPWQDDDRETAKACLEHLLTRMFPHAVRQVTVLTLDDATRLSEQLKQRRAEYRSAADMARNAGIGQGESDE